MNEGAPRLALVQDRYTAGGRSLAVRLGGAWLGRKGVPANLVTLIGTGVCISATVIWVCQIYWDPAFWLGLGLVLPGAWFDAIDGAVARNQKNGETEFGLLLDSNSDRWVEGTMFAALAAVVARTAGVWTVYLTVIALAASFSVSYSRAKGETIDLTGKVGYGARAERLVLLGVGVLLTKISLIAHHQGWIGIHLRYEYTAYAIAALASWTVVRRLSSQRRQLIERGTP